MNIKWLIGAISVGLFISCENVKEAQTVSNSYPSVFPDYTFTAIPYNIAPLNFEVKGAQEIRADFAGEGVNLLTVTGKHEIRIPKKKWKEMLDKLKDKDLEVTVSVWNSSSPEGVRYKPFTVRVASDAIDEWIAYRLIEPGYEGWNMLGIYQRNLTSFEEKEIATNRADKSKCMNCHSFANYSPQQMIFHVRGEGGGAGAFHQAGGTQGALKIARYFEEQGIAFDAVYDEGGIIIAPGLGGIQRTAALVGTAEKGFSTIRITVRGTGGHSSMPPEKGSLVLAAEIIEMLNQERMPAFLTAPVIAFLDRIGGSMGVAQRTAIANRWLLESPLLRSFESNPATNALVRTTTAITMARGSDAANVLASEAEVTVNFRLLPGNTTAQVKRHVENICNGYDVRIEELSTREPSQISPDDVHAFEMIRTSLAGLYPGTIVTPYLTLGGTDAYKYEAVSPNVYRFMPVLLTEQEQGTIHNENESISLENYGRMIAYFRDLIRNYR